jgi:hypothetical protein
MFVTSPVVHGEHVARRELEEALGVAAAELGPSTSIRSSLVP